MSKQICVLGLGYVGLPTACILGSFGYQVMGVDIDPKVIIHLQEKTLITPEPGLEAILKSVLQKNQLKVSTQVEPADIYIIAVPTPLTINNHPNIEYVIAAIDSIKPYLCAHNLIIIESTCPIGTTDNIFQQLHSTFPNIHIAYCPERVLPGNILYELVHNDRIVGGVDEASTLQAVAFYESFVQGKVFATNARTAEAVKLAENAYRDINIAYANELSMIADYLGIDINALIYLANKHPRVQILKPGAGVGGHCVAVDPWFLISSAPELASLTLQARRVNLVKTDWIIDKIKATINKHNVKIVACLGLTYKPDTTDVRGSPALAIAKALQKDTHTILVDPYIPQTDSIEKALMHAQIVVGLVAHKAFANIPKTWLEGKVVMDFAGAFK